MKTKDARKLHFKVKIASKPQFILLLHFRYIIWMEFVLGQSETKPRTNIFSVIFLRFETI